MLELRNKKSYSIDDIGYILRGMLQLRDVYKLEKRNNLGMGQWYEDADNKKLYRGKINEAVKGVSDPKHTGMDFPMLS